MKPAELCTFTRKVTTQITLRVFHSVAWLGIMKATGSALKQACALEKQEI